MLLKLKLAGPNPTKQARKSVLTLRNNVFLSVVFNFFRRNNSVLHNALLKAEWVDGMSWYPNHQDSYYATIAHWFPGIQQLNVYLFDPLRHISLQNAGWGLWFPFPQVTSVFLSTKSNLAKSKPRFTGILYSMDLFGGIRPLTGWGWPPSHKNFIEPKFATLVFMAFLIKMVISFWPTLPWKRLGLLWKQLISETHVVDMVSFPNHV